MGDNRLRGGDLNDDNGVDASDMGLLFDHWYTPGPVGDFNGDGGVDALDMAILFDQWYTSGDDE